MVTWGRGPSTGDIISSRRRLHQRLRVIGRISPLALGALRELKLHTGGTNAPSRTAPGRISTSAPNQPCPPDEIDDRLVVRHETRFPRGGALEFIEWLAMRSARQQQRGGRQPARRRAPRRRATT